MSHTEITLSVSCVLCGKPCVADPCPPRCHFRANMSREHSHYHCASDHPEYPRIRKNHPFVVQFRVRRGPTQPPDDPGPYAA